MTRSFLLLCFLACACGSSEAPPPTAEPQRQAASQIPPRPLEPPAPGEPGGLADDRTPVSEARFTRQSAQGAANLLQTYYALIEAGKYAEAFRLREPSEGVTLDRFAESFDRFSEHHANVGAPSEPQGAAGSLYVEVPVQLYGRLKDGRPFSNAGTVTLRRSNSVPGGSREWRIYTG
jgi:hypothetical protein